MSAALPQLMSLRAVADALRISIRTVRRFIRRGDLVAHKVGGQLRVDASAVRRFLDASRLDAKHKDSTWHGEGTRTGSRTSRGAVENPSSGGAGSVAKKSRSEHQIVTKRTEGLGLLPQNASELRIALKQLRRPN